MELTGQLDPKKTWDVKLIFGSQEKVDTECFISNVSNVFMLLLLYTDSVDFGSNVSS